MRAINATMEDISVIRDATLEDGEILDDPFSSFIDILLYKSFDKTLSNLSHGHVDLDPVDLDPVDTCTEVAAVEKDAVVPPRDATSPRRAISDPVTFVVNLNKSFERFDSKVADRNNATIVIEDDDEEEGDDVIHLASTPLPRSGNAFSFRRVAVAKRRGAFLRGAPNTSTPVKVDERVYTRRPSESPSNLGERGYCHSSNGPTSRKRGRSRDASPILSTPKRLKSTIVPPSAYPARRRSSSFCSLANRPRPRPTHARSQSGPASWGSQSAEYSWFECVADRINSYCEQVVFVDLDNWVNFFGRLKSPLPPTTFVWGFWGAQTQWRRPRNNLIFDDLVFSGRFEETMAGRSKDAADFALVLKIGQLDNRLKDKSIRFTVVSGDRGFDQIRMDFSGWERSVQVLNPHVAFARETWARYPASGFHVEHYIRSCYYEHPARRRRIVPFVSRDG